ncbi:hypothetical protein J1G36_06610 [Pseudomonas carnis]|uniref:Uncharacterized protein n=1 Tax=Pseudomonas kitaguniensis TaxID=2607908 RepID=A0A5N7KHJ8_9PSED|nr:MULTISPECIES: hypothetical protein [Pseudomonas]MBY8951564.1 hypothetical protein [Pseudomonas carnis]MPR01185.1 hypothetical protein [Pseudomonas kitaguniensis]
MTILSEDDLEFDFNLAVEAICFDNNTLHQQSTMKRVDFIAEFADHYVFLEIKDPDRPAAANPDAFTQKLLGGNLIPDLAGKYRDSLWFRTLSGKADKPIQYIVLLSMASLEPALLLAKQDELQRALPIRHTDWPTPCAQACAILNLEQYKKKFGADSVRRLSAGE